MRKIVLLVFLVMLALSFSSCYDAGEIDSLLHVVTIGVDRGISDKWRLSLQFSPMQESEGGGQGSGSSDSEGSQGGYTTVTIDAPSFFTGINMLNTSLPRKLTFTHAQIIVFSEEMAKSGLIGEYIAPIKRFVEIRDSAHVFVVKGKSEEFLKENQPFIGNMLSKSFESFIDESENTGFFPQITLEEFYTGIKSSCVQPIAPLAAINDLETFKKEGEPYGTKFNSGGNYIAGGLPRSGENKIELFGTALFDKDTMVGEFNGDETRYMLMARGEYKRGFFTIEDPKEPEVIIPLDVTAMKKPGVKITFDNARPVVNLKVYLDADILAIQSGINYEKAELMTLLEKKFQQIVKKGLERTIQKGQGLNTDVFKFGEYAKRKFLTIDELENYNWNSHFKDAEIRVKVKVTIRRTGTKIGNSPMKNGGDD